MNIYEYVQYFKNKPLASGKLSLWRELRVVFDKLSECLGKLNILTKSTLSSIPIQDYSTYVTVGSVANNTAMRMSSNSITLSRSLGIPDHYEIILTGGVSIYIPIMILSDIDDYIVSPDRSWHICDGSQRLSGLTLYTRK